MGFILFVTLVTWLVYACILAVAVIIGLIIVKTAINIIRKILGNTYKKENKEES